MPPLDPFVIDLDGDGIELISVEASNAHFDFMDDGFAERTGRLSGDDGFLLADANGNGVVDGIGELFGSATEDGFTELGRADSNGDGLIDANDAIFSSLRIWQDLNGDGVATSDEISTLSDHGIVSIGVDGTRVSEYLVGNEIRYEGDVKLSDGTSLDSGAVFFARNTTLSKWIAPEGFAVDPATNDLPNIKGYGELKDLNAAMSLDSGLRAAVEALVDDAAGLSALPAKYRWQARMLNKRGFDHGITGTPERV
ncbi:hypothetical protein B7H23_04270 [Notoacmeibacter marinus]|uniref:EF-hand domain-containing protein n=1 Tax=Notoacmeibacter marinus TaxID=1876515 RepID=A0A231V1T4_9HYPH|nr:hypothetical protein [Notoacmeibacter marinus]OXT02143.1 hypothetical protein B7H23_04270 [Notoacmeibacter marinus]